jgi:hypothetical protein
MTEMLLCLPLLMLFAAAMVQFTILFLAHVQFEHACGQAAREYSAGSISPEQVPDSVWEHLEGYQAFFVKGSLALESRAPGSSLEELHSRLGGFLRPFQNVLRSLGLASPFGYGEFHRVVRIRCRPFRFFTRLFGQDLLFRTEFAVLRFPE